MEDAFVLLVETVPHVANAGSLFLTPLPSVAVALGCAGELPHHGERKALRKRISLHLHEVISC
jgi:hypothetical protein